MQDIHQSKIYAEFMARIGWTVEKIDTINIFIKKFPLAGAIIKIQRPNTLPASEKLQELKKSYNVKSISFEPNIGFKQQAANYNLLKSPFLPTKTIFTDISATSDQIFKSFTEAKQRAVRRAKKAGVVVSISNIESFIQLKNKTSGLFGFLTTTTLKTLWESLYPNHIAVLSTDNNSASILLLFYKQTAHYWMAAANKEGKQNFAPTLLVWEAIKLAKQKGCTSFDFEGVYDERYPTINKNWLGFTKFKQGFGGKEIYYPKPFFIR